MTAALVIQITLRYRETGKSAPILGQPGAVTSRKAAAISLSIPPSQRILLFL